MELGSLIFGIAALACFIVPVIYLQMSKNNEKKKFLKDFARLASSQHQLTLSQSDFWNHAYAIGLDKQKNKLFFQKKGSGTGPGEVIDLNKVSACRLNNKTRDMKDTRVIDVIQLSFSFRNTGQTEKHLRFFDKEEDMVVNQELALAEKWNAIINDHIKNQSQAQSIKGVETGSKIEA